MSQTAVLLCHGHSLVRLGMAAVLSALKGISVHTAGDLREALALASATPTPAAVLVSADFPGLDVLLARLYRRGNGMEEGRIAVALTGPFNSALSPAAWPPGVHGYLPEDAEPDELGHAIRVLASGAAVFPSCLLAESADRIRLHAATRGDAIVDRLSGREREVLDQLAAGRSNQQIANKLGLSQGTVKSYVASIFVKIGVGNRVQAALWAHGIGTPTNLDIANQTAWTGASRTGASGRSSTSRRSPAPASSGPIRSAAGTATR